MMKMAVFSGLVLILPLVPGPLHARAVVPADGPDTKAAPAVWAGRVGTFTNERNEPCHFRITFAQGGYRYHTSDAPAVKDHPPVPEHQEEPVVDIVVPGNSGSLTFECYGDGLDTNFSHQGYAILSFDITAADPRKVLAVDCDYLYMGKAMRDAIDARQKSTPTGFRNLKGRKPVEALKGSHCALQTSPANPSRMALVNITQAPGGPHIQTAD